MAYAQFLCLHLISDQTVGSFLRLFCLLAAALIPSYQALQSFVLLGCCSMLAGSPGHLEKTYAKVLCQVDSILLFALGSSSSLLAS